jgi:hypothetical protein
VPRRRAAKIYETIDEKDIQECCRFNRLRNVMTDIKVAVALRNSSFQFQCSESSALIQQSGF